MISVLLLFAITAAGVVPYGGPKKSHRTSSIMQIIFSFWSFLDQRGCSEKQKIIISSYLFSDSRLICLAPFGL